MEWREILNAKRRKKVSEACDHLNVAIEILEDVLADEQDCLDNTPENLQESQAYSDREDMIDSMQDAIDDVKSAVQTFENVIA